MKVIRELLWLGKPLGIALAAAAVCVLGAVLTGRAAKKTVSRRTAAIVGAAAFALASVIVILLARTPMPIQ